MSQAATDTTVVSAQGIAYACTGEEHWMGDLGNDVVSGGVMGDEACQDDDGGVLQVCVCLLNRTHQGLQIRVLLQQHPSTITTILAQILLAP